MISSHTTFTKREIYVNEILFYSKHEIQLLGFIHQSGKFLETQYLITRNDLQMLLSQTKTGLEILWRIENLFVLPHEVPATLNLVDMFGTTQLFEAQNIQLEAPLYENELGEIQPEPAHGLLFVEQVIPFPCARKNRSENF